MNAPHMVRTGVLGGHEDEQSPGRRLRTCSESAGGNSTESTITNRDNTRRSRRGPWLRDRSRPREGIALVGEATKPATLPDSNDAESCFGGSDNPDPRNPREGV